MRVIPMALCFAALLAAGLHAQDAPQQDDQARYTYSVRAYYVSGGEANSDPYPTLERAMEELEQWKKDHGPGGILEAAPFRQGPFLLRHFMGKAEPIPLEPIDPAKPLEKPGETTPSAPTPDAKPDAPPAPTFTPPALAGRRIVGLIGPKIRIEAEFRGQGNQGTVVIWGDANGSGRWVQDGTELRIETSVATYRASIEKEGTMYFIKGSQQKRTGNQPPADLDWTIVPTRAELMASIEADKPSTDAPDSKPSTDSSASKVHYICWHDEFGSYGGSTKEEAIELGRQAKKLNPSLHIRVTEHANTGVNTVQEIRETPGVTILDLP